MIDLPHLHHTALAQQHSARDAFGVSVKPSVLLAFIEAVKAAHEMVYPGGILDPSWMGSRLKRAVDQFDLNKKET